MADTTTPAPSANEIQWRNIRKVVRALADLCFGSADHPQYGHCHQAIVNSLTAKDGLDISALDLEPLPMVPTPAGHVTLPLQTFTAWQALILDWRKEPGNRLQELSVAIRNATGCPDPVVEPRPAPPPTPGVPPEWYDRTLKTAEVLVATLGMDVLNEADSLRLVQTSIATAMRWAQQQPVPEPVDQPDDSPLEVGDLDTSLAPVRGVGVRHG